MYATTRGMLLLATPPLDDPNFDRSVVYMMEHSAEGAVGVVLNHPTEETEIDGLDLWMDLSAPPAVVFNGGPGAVRCIDRDRRATRTAGRRLEPDPGRSGQRRSRPRSDRRGRRSRTGTDVPRLCRLGAGQLDSELAAGAWMVFDAQRDDVFHPEPEDLWRLILRRQRGRVAWLANAPDDLSMN